MNEFCFEPTAWELTLDGLKVGESLSAVRLLTLLEGEDESELEAAFEALTARRIALDIGDLPKLPCEGESAERLQMEEKLANKPDLRLELEENDSLRLYLEEISQIPAAGDPAVLALELAQGDRSVAPRLMELMLSRVIDLAKGYVGRGVLLLDLIQEGSLGLFEGLKTYQGGDIYDHCDWYTHQLLAAAVTVQAREAGVGQKMRRSMEDYRDVDQRLLTELGRNPTIEEIAQALHMTVDQAAAVGETLESAQLLQRAKAPGKAEEEEKLAQTQAVEDTAYFQMRQRIEELLSTLSPEDAQLLTLRFGLEGGLPMDPAQVGKRLGLTADEVVSREAQALAKLRNQ